MKVIAYTALHYGIDYLYWAIRSVIDHVDEHHILYSPVGSHGHRTGVPCPDTRSALYAEAQRAAGDKLRWHDGQWIYEGQQRDSIFSYAPDADIILTVDADEIWNVPDWGYLMDQVIRKEVRRLRVPMLHYWRSFQRAILHDPAYPERIINTRIDNDVETIDASFAFINHMGYAQRPEIVAYKLLTHGHRDQFRRDCDWFADKFMTNAQHDTHPVGSEYWNPEPVNPQDYMPAWMSEHPYFAMDVIGPLTEVAR